MVIINHNMAKKIYNKNAREAHLMAEAYQRVYNENAEENRKDLARDQERADNSDYARSKRYEDEETQLEVE